jgi:hypothetical protein
VVDRYQPGQPENKSVKEMGKAVKNPEATKVSDEEYPEVN